MCRTKVKKTTSCKAPLILPVRALLLYHVQYKYAYVAAKMQMNSMSDCLITACKLSFTVRRANTIFRQLIAHCRRRRHRHRYRRRLSCDVVSRMPAHNQLATEQELMFKFKSDQCAYALQLAVYFDQRCYNNNRSGHGSEK